MTTGASFCVFGTETAGVLGLNLEGGIRTGFRTANSKFKAFGDELELSVLGCVTNTVVYFFADPMIDKNVLGRIRATPWMAPDSPLIPRGLALIPCSTIDL